jgi:hypothetical protein
MTCSTDGELAAAGSGRPSAGSEVSNPLYSKTLTGTDSSATLTTNNTTFKVNTSTQRPGWSRSIAPIPTWHPLATANRRA